jgi:hypothetical protein
MVQFIEKAHTDGSTFVAAPQVHEAYEAWLAKAQVSWKACPICRTNTLTIADRGRCTACRREGRTK